MLIKGWDEISITLQYDENISAYESTKKAVSSIQLKNDIFPSFFFYLKGCRDFF